MNKTYRLIWNELSHSWVPAPEGARARGKRCGGALRLVALGAALLAVGAAAAQVLPSGGQIVAGSGSIAQSGNTLTVTQHSDKLITHWQNFSVGAGQSVNFVQPGRSAIALNRVLGSDVSTIQGALNANGQLFLVNPNGVLFTASAQVNVGSLVASTLNLSDADFLAGRYTFSGDSRASVVNAGRIQAAAGGEVALIAARVSNSGSIATGDGGRVQMGAGRRVLLDLGGPAKLEVEAGALDALIEQGGAIRADGGLIYLTAKSAGEMAGSVIRHTGTSEARTLVGGAKGEIYLMGDLSRDSIQVGGTLDASAPRGGDGGFIETSAARVDLSAGRKISTQAAQGRTGTWLIDPNDYTIAASGGDISGAQLSADLTNTNVTIATTSQGTGGGQGDIIVNDGIDWNGANTLTLKAERHIQINQPIRHAAGTGDLILRSDADADGSGAVKFANADTRYVDFRGSDGNIKLYYSPTGSGWAKYVRPTSFDKNIAMGGGALAPYMLINTGEDLLGFVGSTSGTSGYVFGALGRDIDPGSSNTLGTLSGGVFRGVLDGDGHTISNMKIGGSGLFYTLEGAILKNFTLDASNSIVLTSRGGALAGRATNSVFENLVNKADIRFANYPFNDGGGLVDQFNYGVMINVENRGTVHVGSNTQGVGGVVGRMYASSLYGVRNYGEIRVVGTPLAADNYRHGVGGVVWTSVDSKLVDVQNYGNIFALFANNVPDTQPIYVGGIVGSSYQDSISYAQQRADITVSSAGRTYVGGIAGQLSGRGTPIVASNLLSQGNFNITATKSATGNSNLFFGGLFGAVDATATVSGKNVIHNAIAQYTLTLDPATNIDSNRLFSAGLVGSVSQPTEIRDAYWNAAGSALQYANGAYNGAGGAFVTSDVSAKTEAELLDVTTYRNGSWSDWRFDYRGVGQPLGSLPRFMRRLVAYSEPMLKYYDSQAYSAGAAAAHLKVAGGSLADTTGSATVSGGFVGETQAKTGGGQGDAKVVSLAGLDAADSDTAVLIHADSLASIKPRLITVTPDDASKVYGDADALSWRITAGQMLGADRVSGAVNRQIGENAGIYSVYAQNLTADSNYFLLRDSGRLTIRQRPITISTDNLGKTYGQADPAIAWRITAGQLVNGDTFSGNATRSAGENAGSYAINLNTITLSANYALTRQPGTFTIDKAALTITANDASKTYDRLGWSGGNGVSYSGFVNGETAAVLGGSLVFSGNSQGASQAGRYVLTPGGLSAGNYAIRYVDGALTIDKAVLTVGGLTVADKVYDGSTNARLLGAGMLSGVKAGDSVSLSGVATALFADAQAGANKAVAVTGLSLGGADAGNYSLSAPTGFSATIGAAPLTITAQDASKTYDRQAWLGGNGVSYSGFVNGETAAVLGGSLVYGGNSQGASQAGRYVLTPGGLTSGNYAIRYVDGALTIDKAVLTLSGLRATDKVYDGSTHARLAGTASLNGVLGGDAVHLSGAVSGQFADANAGSGKTLTVTGLTLGGAQAGNYTVVGPTGLTANIATAPLTITASDAGKTYDGQGWSGGNGVSYSGFVNGETAAVLGGSLVYGGGSQGARQAGRYVLTPAGLSSNNYAIRYADGVLTIAPRAITVTADDARKVYGEADPTLSYRVTGGSLVGNDRLSGALTRAAGEAVGRYRIDASALANGNYEIRVVDGTMSITPRAITVTADDARKVYGEADPTLSYRVTGGSLVGNDRLSGALTRAAGEAAGRYRIDASALANGNYEIRVVDGTMSITPRAITVTADDARKVYGETDPTLSYRVTDGSLVGNDRLSGALTRAAGEAVGRYRIDASALANGNYLVTAQDGTLTIVAAPVPQPGPAALETARASAVRQVPAMAAPLHTAAVGSRPQLQDNSSLNLVPIRADQLAATLANGSAGRDAGGTLRVLVIDGGLRLSGAVPAATRIDATGTVTQ